MLLIGIDEAGYGPLLGPLVVSAVAMKLPDEQASVSLWKLFASGLTDKTTKTQGKIIVADSKKVFHGKSRDILELERSALAACFLVKNQFPQNLDELIKTISIEPDPHLTHKWYCHNSLALPNKVSQAALSLSTSLLKRTLDSTGAKITAVHTIPLVEKKFNYLVEKTKNKSEILFTQTVRLIDHVINKSNEKQIRVCVDKQGGKDNYLRSLLRTFPDAQLSIIKQDEEESQYIMNMPPKTINITFTKKGEQKHLLIAWASIVSKYIRELFMHQFNSFWLASDPTLIPTAGYWQDGQRFMKDIQPLLTKLKIPESHLIRQL